jgi:dephospho-CoA kinase
MAKRLIVQITGEAGSGKSDACAYLAQKHDFSVVQISDLIRSYAAQRGLELSTRSDYRLANLQMKSELGNDILVTQTLQTDANRLCVGGLRVVNDVQRLRTAVGVASLVVALDCPPEVRFERTILRGPGLDKRTYDEFLEDDRQDAISAVPELPNLQAVMKMADYHIDASLPQAQVFEAIDDIVAPLL